MALRRASAGQIVDLQPLGTGLKQARTTAIVKSEAFEAVRLVVRAGNDIKPHKVNGPITLHCLEGQALLRLPAATLELSGGQWVYLDGGEPHSISAIEDTSFLLTILFANGNGRAASNAVPEGAADAEAEISATVGRLEAILDEGLAETFPASDPVSVSNPSIGIRIQSRSDPGTNN
jgi:quercetin dioxygenase-like cupin family protein